MPDLKVKKLIILTGPWKLIIPRDLEVAAQHVRPYGEAPWSVRRQSEGKCG